MCAVRNAHGKGFAYKNHRFYDPSIGEDRPWYINDHCVIRGKEEK